MDRAETQLGEKLNKQEKLRLFVKHYSSPLSIAFLYLDIIKCNVYYEDHEKSGKFFSLNNCVSLKE